MGLEPSEKCCLHCNKEEGFITINIYDAGFMLAWLCYAVGLTDTNTKDSIVMIIWLIAIAAGVNFIFMLFSVCKNNQGGVSKLYFWVRFICIIVEPGLIFFSSYELHYGLQLCILLTFIFGLNFYYQWFMIHGIR